jgi:hypothetical protein
MCAWQPWFLLWPLLTPTGSKGPKNNAIRDFLVEWLSLRTGPEGESFPVMDEVSFHRHEYPPRDIRVNPDNVAENTGTNQESHPLGMA